MPSSSSDAQQFLAYKHLYQLGDLTTEKPHPLTTDLSDLAQNDLPYILSLIQKIELKLVLDVMAHLPEIENLHEEIKKTLKAHGRIFICGCGATGRLALTLEYLWRHQAPQKFQNQVIGFMAGGDVALVRSLERIEDLPEAGAQHLRSLNFSSNDLLISCTEGGETPFVIGATQQGASLSQRPPYFLFCNPKSLLMQKIERSRQILTHPQIRSVELVIDPMVLAGSTRMQATTALFLAVGSALFSQITGLSTCDYLVAYEAEIKNLNFEKLKKFIELESFTYQENEFTLYQTDEYGITILTDTTERSPTFSLAPFENLFETNPQPSLCYLYLVNTGSSQEAWMNLLGRPVRLEGYPEWIKKLGPKWTYGYDFSAQGKDLRLRRQNPNWIFNIWPEDKNICFEFRDHREKFYIQTSELFLKHLILKVLLNTHSTLVMGRLQRYHKNIMTFVKPSCGKLIDRAVRNIQFLLKTQNQSLIPSYDDLVIKIFEQIPNLKPSDSIVLKVIDSLK